MAGEDFEEVGDGHEELRLGEYRGVVGLYLNLLGLLSLLAAMATGLLSWHVNYMGRRIGNVTGKITLSAALLTMSVVVALLLARDPGAISSPRGSQLIAPVLIILYVPLVSLLGYLGGQLVFPTPRRK